MRFRIREIPLYGTCKTLKTGFRPWLQLFFRQKLMSCSFLASQRDVEGTGEKVASVHTRIDTLRMTLSVALLVDFQVDILGLGYNPVNFGAGKSP